MSKRRRDPTFTITEKETLLDLVETNVLIVDCKKTDAVSIRKKNEEWQKIALEFNAISGIHSRDWTVLKNCWENLKKRAKQELTSHNQNYLGTGGGPPSKGGGDPTINRVLDLIQARVSQYTPKLLKKNIDPLALANSPSPDVQAKKEHPPDNNLIPSPRALSPSVIRLRPSAGTRRRRPVHKYGIEYKDILQEKRKTSQAEEEHSMRMKILELQERKEKEMLKQEILKTQQEEIKLEILEIQLNKLKN